MQVFSEFKMNEQGSRMNWSRLCVCLCSCVCVCVPVCVCMCVDSLVEFQVQDEGSAKGLYQETALGQMDRLRVGWREGGGGGGKKKENTSFRGGAGQ